MKNDNKKPQRWKVEASDASKSKRASTAKMRPSPAILLVYVLVSSRKVTWDPREWKRKELYLIV